MTPMLDTKCGRFMPRAQPKAYLKGRINSRVFPVGGGREKSIAGGLRIKLETADQFWYKLSMQ